MGAWGGEESQVWGQGADSQPRRGASMSCDSDRRSAPVPAAPVARDEAVDGCGQGTRLESDSDGRRLGRQVSRTAGDSDGRRLGWKST